MAEIFLNTYKSHTLVPAQGMIYRLGLFYGSLRMSTLNQVINNMAAAITTTATTLEGQIYELALEMLSRENLIAPDNRPDNTQIAYDTEAETVAITVSLETNLALNGAEAQITVKPYLA